MVFDLQQIAEIRFSARCESDRRSEYVELASTPYRSVNDLPRGLSTENVTSTVYAIYYKLSSDTLFFC